MVVKMTEVDKITINKDGVIHIVESTSFVDGNHIDACTPTERIIVPGDDLTDESEKLRSLISIVFDNETVEKYKEGRRLRSMGFKTEGDTKSPEEIMRIQEEKVHNMVNTFGSLKLKNVPGLQIKGDSNKH